MENAKEEEWRDIEGYEGLYKVSNFERVKNLNKKRILKTWKDTCQYKRIGLNKKNKSTLFLLHRLIAEAFIPNPENKPCINHINGIKTDNRIENLEWCYYSENVKHAYEIGLRSHKGEKHPQVKLTKDQVILIREMREYSKQFPRYYQPFTSKWLAKCFKISESCVKHIEKRRSWKHI